METFYDGDLKDIWDSDLDPTDSLKLSTDSDMHDWFLERDAKDAAVILNDKLISDALLNGTLPIKSEHSYSLNSDGESLPCSPHNLQSKMNDMEEDYYPAISLKTVTCNRRGSDSISIDPKCFTISSSDLSSNPLASAVSVTSVNTTNQSNPGLVLNGGEIECSSANGSLCNTSSTPVILNNRNYGSCPNVNNAIMSTDTKPIVKQPATQLHQQFLPQVELCAIMEDSASSTTSREGSQSPDICSDIEIDEACIKNEPMSPESCYADSPDAEKTEASGTLSLTMANMAAFTNSDLVFERKLATSSQNLLKTQRAVLGGNPQNVIVPKLSIKSEAGPNRSGLFANTGPTITKSYGLPLTPPSSLSSDGSEGNLTPEHLLSPQSPTSSSITRTSTSSDLQPTSGILTVTSIRRNNPSSFSSTTSSTSSCVSLGRHTSGGSTRQPIHTPLISSQPKGSTGTLLLTEEEKRTLLAEGYPIPQKLPLTKAEEKSLKKIRRKIKNKISAQESRRKKKEYMDQLERKVEILVNENCDYKKRVKSLEDSNAGLLSQLHKLQAIVNKHNLKKS